MLAALLLSTALLWGGGWWPRRGPAVDSDLVAMTWNVQRLGWWVALPDEQSSRLRGVTRVIRETAPDLLALQEISEHELDQLQARLGLSCTWIDYYGKGKSRFGGIAACVPDGGGLKVLRQRDLDMPPRWKYVFLEVETAAGQRLNFMALHVAPPGFDLPSGAVGGPGTALKLLRQEYRELEARLALQNRQADRVLKVIGSFRDPTVVAGDFNSTRDTALHARFRRQLVDAWQRGGLGLGATRWWHGLPLRIDFIYLSRELATRRAETLDEACSDHRPVVVRFAAP
jgi:endonuclease/exonuclease/phosphatase family metal-dependent hydrolase